MQLRLRIALVVSSFLEAAVLVKLIRGALALITLSLVVLWLSRSARGPLVPAQEPAVAGGGIDAHAAPQSDLFVAAHERLSVDPDENHGETVVASPLPEALFRVTHDDGAPAHRATVLLTRLRLRSASAVRSLAGLDDYEVVHRGLTDEAGRLSFSCSEKGECHVWVEGEDGIAMRSGPKTIDLGSLPSEPLVYVIGGVLAGAFVLSDGAVVDHSSWEFDSAPTLGLGQGRVGYLHQQLSDKLALSWAQVFVGVGAVDSRSLVEIRVSIFHPKIGWFRHAVSLGSYRSATPTVITPPASGEGSPVRVTLDCVTGEGVPCQINGVRLHGLGGVSGFPRIVDVFPSGKERVLPSGRYMVQFTDAALTKAIEGPKVFDIKSDQRIEVKLRWSVRDIRVIVVQGGVPLRGPSTVTLKVGQSTLYRRRYVDIRDGGLDVNVPNERDSEVWVSMDGGSSVLRIDANSDAVEYRIELEK